MGDEIYIDKVTRSIISGISERITDELEDRLQDTLMKQLLDELTSAISGEIKAEAEKLLRHSDKKTKEIQDGYKNMAESLVPAIEEKLSGIEGMSKSITADLNSSIKQFIGSNKGGQPMDMIKIEAIILKEFLRLYEVQEERENEHRNLLEKNLFLLQQMEAAYEKDRVISLRLETQLNEALNAISMYIKNSEDRKDRTAGETKEDGDKVVKVDALEKFKSWLISINDEIKKTRVIAESAWEEKLEAQKKLEEIQRLWEKQKKSNAVGVNVKVH